MAQSQHNCGTTDVINTFCIKIQSIGIWQSKGFSTPTTAGVASTIRDEAYIQRRDWGQYVRYNKPWNKIYDDTTNRETSIQRRDWGQYVRYNREIKYKRQSKTKRSYNSYTMEFSLCDGSNIYNYYCKWQQIINGIQWYSHKVQYSILPLDEISSYRGVTGFAGLLQPKWFQGV